MVASAACPARARRGGRCGRASPPAVRCGTALRGGGRGPRLACLHDDRLQERRYRPGIARVDDGGVRVDQELGAMQQLRLGEVLPIEDQRVDDVERGRVEPTALVPPRPYIEAVVPSVKQSESGEMHTPYVAEATGSCSASHWLTRSYTVMVGHCR